MSEFGGEVGEVLGAALRVLPWLVAYVALILLLLAVARGIGRLFGRARGDAMRRTVAFGDAGAVRSSGLASVLSVAAIFLLWAAFTGSALVPSWLRAPAAYEGQGSFAYTAEAPDGTRDDATVTVLVHPNGEEPEAPEVAPGEGFAKDDAVLIPAQRSDLVPAQDNDEVTGDDGARVVALNGTAVEPGGAGVDLGWGRASLTARGTINVVPDPGWQMEAIWLPPP